MIHDHIKNAVFRFIFKNMVRFTAPSDPQLYEGVGASASLCEDIGNDVSNKILVITTPGLIKRGSLKSSFDALKKKNIEYVIFDAVEPNPSMNTVKEAIKFYHEENCEGVLAYGGGSVIDAAKAVALQIGNNVPLEKLVGLFKGRKKAVPFYVVPTTAGTGSEITSASVLTNSETHQKIFVLDHKTIPIATALDPEPMMTMPDFITADTGMDALTHAIESYISRANSPNMLELAASAVNRIFEFLPKAYTNGSDIEARMNMARASFDAGKAFNHMGLGFVHAISHQITAYYDTPHGRTNAIILPHVLIASIDKIAPCLARLSRHCGFHEGPGDDLTVANDFIAKVLQLADTVNIPKNIPEIKDADISAVVKNARKEAISTYPVPKLLSSKECAQILDQVKTG